MLLTHCGLVTPYGGRDLSQHWLRQWLVAWRHQAITWTNVDLSSLRSSDVHLRAISLEISQPSASKISLKIIFLGFYWNFPGVNELTFYVCHCCGYHSTTCNIRPRLMNVISIHLVLTAIVFSDIGCCRCTNVCRLRLLPNIICHETAGLQLDIGHYIGCEYWAVDK